MRPSAPAVPPPYSCAIPALPAPGSGRCRPPGTRPARAAGAARCTAPSIPRLPRFPQAPDRDVQVVAGLEQRRVRQRRRGHGRQRARALRGMPSGARSAAAMAAGSGNTCVRPSCGRASGAPCAATSLPPRRIAATTVICWPSTARIASSKPSQAPGMRKPGRAAVSAASTGSCDSCAAMAAGSLSRSNCRRRRAMITGRDGSRGKRTVASSASPLPGSTATVPCAPSRLMLRV